MFGSPFDILYPFALSQLYDRLANITLTLEMIPENFTLKVLSLYNLMLFCKSIQKGPEIPQLPSAKDISNMLSKNLNIILNIYQQYAYMPSVPTFADIFFIMEKSSGNNKPIKKRYFVELFENKLCVFRDTKSPEDSHTKELYSIPISQIQSISPIHDNGFSILTKQRMYFIQAEHITLIRLLWKRIYLTVIRLHKLTSVIRFLDDKKPRITYDCSIKELLTEKEIVPFNESNIELRTLNTSLPPPYCNQQITE